MSEEIVTLPPPIVEDSRFESGALAKFRTVLDEMTSFFAPATNYLFAVEVGVSREATSFTEFCSAVYS